MPRSVPRSVMVASLAPHSRYRGNYIMHHHHRQVFMNLFIYVFGFIVASSLALAATPAGTAFTYQGRLSENDLPADGGFDFEFRLHDEATSGTQVGDVITLLDVQVSRGIFRAELDFGTNVFEGDARWLEIALPPAGAGGLFTVLTPRQELTPSPYAIHALNVSDNSIGGPKLKRESVWPEHAGRSNTIKSYTASDFAPTKMTVATLAEIPGDKTFIITDISWSWNVNSSNYATGDRLVLSIMQENPNKLLYRSLQAFAAPSNVPSPTKMPWHLTFRSGIPVSPGSTLKMQIDSVQIDPAPPRVPSQRFAITVSGFEISN